ncbi:hypothetical protein [Candidatus Enterococcus clewellii]|uniref:Uncharacterized protein n=1 Tax=Candidatus Enterococcus clewellii TaxID=1834193 RepID=A0A242KAN5_9ENTE|nr:hypothetical protein [Enterococcus sp. 9E7_DIV0242]OTP18212.1 hypothetical protein A5888_000024 [Enterococcus sp. 9E7_DIV0242]
MSYPVNNSIFFNGSVDRSQAPLVPHRNAFPAAMMSLGVLMGLTHDTSLIDAHGRMWRMDHDHNLHMGISGEAFRFMFDTAEYFSFSMSDGAMPVRDCFSAIGLSCELYATKTVNGIDGVYTDDTEIKKLILKNLCAGFPVLLVGDRRMDRVILAIGYEEAGETLIGWTFSTGNDIPNKCFSPQDCQYITKWYQDIGAAVLVKGKSTRPSNEQLVTICRRALERNERFLRGARNASYGLDINYYDNWIEVLKDDSFWAPTINGFPYIYPEIFDLAERRMYGAEFLKRVGYMLDTDKLLPAVDAGNEIHSLMWSVHSIINETEKGNNALYDRLVRKKIGETLHKCRALDKIIADCIVEVLK